MQKEKLSTIPNSHPVNTARMITMRAELVTEIAGRRVTSPTAYIRIKREFDLTGSRKSVLRQFTKLIEDRLHETS